MYVTYRHIKAAIGDIRKLSQKPVEDENEYFQRFETAISKAETQEDGCQKSNAFIKGIITYCRSYLLRFYELYPDCSFIENLEEAITEGENCCGRSEALKKNYPSTRTASTLLADENVEESEDDNS